MKQENQEKALTKSTTNRLPTNWQSNWLTSIATRSDASQDFAKQAIEGYNNPMRDLDWSKSKTNKQVQGFLVSMFGTYGTRQTVPPEVIREIISYSLRTKFKHLGLNEVREAYRLWSVGEIQAQEMYGGFIDVRQFNSVLAGYEQKRRRVIAEFIRRRDEQIQAEQDEQRKAELRAKVAENYENDLKNFQGTWHDVPSFWYDIAKDRGEIALTKKEQVEYWEWAKWRAEADLTAEAVHNRTLGKVFDASEIQHRMTDMVKARAKVYALKKAFFEKIIKADCVDYD